MSDFKNIFGFFDVDSTVKPTVLDVTYYDNSSVVTSPIDTTEVFQLRLRFSKEMDSTIEPTVELDSNGTLDPVVPAGGEWSNIIVSGDAYTTPVLPLSGDHVGTITVKCSGGTSEDGNVMDANNTVDTFTLQAAVGPTLNAIYINEGRSEYTNSPNVALAFSSLDAAQMWISGDVQDDASTNQWISYAASGDVVLNSGDGDGTKTVYVKFQDTSGDESGFVSDYIVLDRSGDAITDLACSQASGGSAIGNAGWQTYDTPYFYWTVPTSTSPIRGYAYVLTSGDGTVGEVPEAVNLWRNSIDFAYNNITPGKRRLFVKAQDKAGNWGSGDQFDFWLASGDSFVMTGEIQAWTDPSKLYSITNGQATSSGDSRIYLEWQDPQSPFDDTFYIQTSGDDVNENDYAHSSGDASLFTEKLNVGVHRILVRPITGLGVSGDIQEFMFIWASGDIF